MRCRVSRTIETQYKRPPKAFNAASFAHDRFNNHNNGGGLEGEETRNGTLYTHYDSVVLICIHIGSLLYVFVTKTLPRCQNTPQGRTIQGDSMAD